MARADLTSFSDQPTGGVPRWATPWSASWTALAAAQGRSAKAAAAPRQRTAVNLAIGTESSQRDALLRARARRVAAGVALCAAASALLAFGLAGCGSKPATTAAAPVPQSTAPQTAPKADPGTRDNEATEWVQGSQG